MTKDLLSQGAIVPVMRPTLPADLVRETQSLCDARNLTEFRRGSDRQTYKLHSLNQVFAGSG